MSIRIKWPWQLEDLSNQVAVIVDLWAATTNIALFLGKGVEKLIVINKENAREAKSLYKNSITAGEHYQLPKNFFDYSNYPEDVDRIKPSKTVLYMTTNGTYAIEQALKKRAEKVFTASLIHFDTIVSYLVNSDFKNLMLVPAGNIISANREAEEDILCAEMFYKALNSEEINENDYSKKLRKIIRLNYASEEFDEGANLDIVFAIDKYDVIPVCNNKDGWIMINNLNL